LIGFRAANSSSPVTAKTHLSFNPDCLFQFDLDQAKRVPLVDEDPKVIYGNRDQFDGKSYERYDRARPRAGVSPGNDQFHAGPAV
jgi:hypothetical protein